MSGSLEFHIVKETVPDKIALLVSEVGLSLWEFVQQKPNVHGWVRALELWSHFNMYLKDVINLGKDVLSKYPIVDVVKAAADRLEAKISSEALGQIEKDVKENDFKVASENLKANLGGIKFTPPKISKLWETLMTCTSLSEKSLSVEWGTEAGKDLQSNLPVFVKCQGVDSDVMKVLAPEKHALMEKFVGHFGKICKTWLKEEQRKIDEMTAVLDIYRFSWARERCWD